MRQLSCAALLCLSVAFPAYAQSPEQVYALGQVYLNEAGLLTEAQSTRVEGETLVIEGFKLFPEGEVRPWTLEVGTMTLSQEAGDLVLRPESFVVQARIGRVVVPITFTHEDLALRIAMSGSEISGFSLEADTVAASLSAGTDVSARLEFRDLAFAETEMTQVELEQTLSWAGVSGEWRSVSPMDGEIVDLMLDLGPMRAELETMQAGLLDTYDWFGAVGAGMSVMGEMDIGRSALIAMMRADAQSEPKVQRFEFGQFEASGSQGVIFSSLNWSGSGVQISSGAGEAAPFSVRAETLTGSMALPLFATPEVQAVAAKLAFSGELQLGELVLPMQSDLALDVQARPVINWYDYSIVEQTGRWRSPEMVFDLRTIDSTGSLSLGEETIDLKADLARQAADGTIGLQDALEGTTTLTFSSTTPVFDIVGKSGLFSEGANTFVLSLFKELMGPQAGVEGGVVTIESKADGAVTVNGIDLR